MPEIVSSIRMAIGCVKFHAMPGMVSISLSTASISASLLWNLVHVFMGFSERYVSPSLIPIASVAKSGRPILTTTSAISGNDLRRLSMRLLISTESVSEIPGNLRVSIRIEPSSSFGMNSVPMKKSDPSATPSTIAENATVIRRWFIVHVRVPV